MTALETSTMPRSTVQPMGPYWNIQCERAGQSAAAPGLSGHLAWFGRRPTPFGEALVFWCDQGILALSFAAKDDASDMARFQKRWPELTLQQASEVRLPWLDRLWDAPPVWEAPSSLPRPESAPDELRIVLRGTDFQCQVWRRLLQIPMGSVMSYAQLAADIGRPGAQRAVGSALAANVLACLVPCHRVLRSDGQVGQFLWGSPRKQALLQWEAERAGIMRQSRSS